MQPLHFATQLHSTRLDQFTPNPLHRVDSPPQSSNYNHFLTSSHLTLPHVTSIDPLSSKQRLAAYLYTHSTYTPRRRDLGVGMGLGLSMDLGMGMTLSMGATSISRRMEKWMDGWMDVQCRLLCIHIYTHLI